ncbi:MAG: aspartyl protease family protein [Planctomycetaceae bacterium]
MTQASRVSVFVFFAALCCCNCAKGDPSQAWEPPNTLVSIEFENLGNAIIVPVSVDGKVGSFLLDTGAACTVVDEKFLSEENRLRKIHPEKNADSQSSPYREIVVNLNHGEAKRAALYKPPKMLLNGFELKSNQGFVASEVFSSPKWVPLFPPLPIDGILGMDLFRQHCLHIDYDRKRLVIFQSVSDGVVPPGEKVHIRLDEHVPCIRVNVNGYQVWSRIDTGCICNYFALKESVLKDVLKQQSAELSDAKQVNTSFLNLYLDGFEVPGSLHCGPYREESPTIHKTDNFTLWGHLSL